MSQIAVVTQQTAVNLLAVGNTVDFDTSEYLYLLADCNLTVLSGGASPTVVFILQRKSANGDYVPLATAAALSAVGVKSLDAGPGTQAAGSAQVPGSLGRIAWTITGAPTTVTANLALSGRV